MPITAANVRSPGPIPGAFGAVVVPANTDTTLACSTTCLYVSHNAAWSITVVMENGDSVVIQGHTNGIVLPIRVTRVTASTAAMHIVAMF